MTVLRIDTVARRFGGLVALQDISIDVKPGTCHALIGPNGAGKTTLLNLVAGTLRPSAGRIVIDGRDVTPLAATRRSRHGIGRTFQHPALFRRLTVTDNLALATTKPAELLLDQAGLAEHAHRPAGALPYGLQRRLELAMVLAQQPRLLLLDEPSAGLDPDEVAHLTQQIRGLNADVTVLLVDHNLDLVWTLADTVTVLHHGRHLTTGPTATVRADPAVHDAYLSTGHYTPASANRSTAGPVLLRARGLTAGYHGAPVLHEIDFDIHEGETVAVLGRNGAGKTTLLSAVAGLLPVRPPSRVDFEGRPLPVRRPHRLARAGVAIVPQGRRLFGPLTVIEHLIAARTALGHSRSTPLWTVDRVLMLLPALAARTRHQARRLSGGEQQMLALARALLTNPRLLILDEPSEGLAPAVIAQFVAALSTLRNEGIAILIAEQNLPLAAAVADRVVVLDRGRVAMAATTADVDGQALRASIEALLSVAGGRCAERSGWPHTRLAGGSRRPNGASDG